MVFSVNQYTDKKNTEIFYLEIFTKDFRTLKFQILLLEKGNDLYDNIRNLSFPGMYTDSCFASKYMNSLCTPAIEMSENEVIVDYRKSCLTNPELFELYFKNEEFPENGWEVYKYRNEFKRQGINKLQYK